MKVKKFGRRAVRFKPVVKEQLDTPFAMIRYTPGYGLFLHRMIDIKTRQEAEEYVRTANKAGKTIGYPKGMLIDLRELLESSIDHLNDINVQ